MTKILLLATIALATTKAPREPYIASDTQGENHCSTDPKPCYSRILVVHNPFKRPIVVNLTCDVPGLQLDGTIPARGDGTFEFVTDIGGGLKEGQCRIGAWVK